MCYEIQCKASAAQLAALLLDLWALLMDYNYAVSQPIPPKKTGSAGAPCSRIKNEAKCRRANDGHTVTIARTRTYMYLTTHVMRPERREKIREH